MGHGGGSGGAAEAAVGALGAARGGDIVMVLVTVTVVLRVINFHYFKWPASIMMAFGSIGCTVVLLLLARLPYLGISRGLSDFRLLFMDFPDLVLNYMLGFLLFAASIEVDMRALGRIKSTIIALSFFTTFISAFIVSALTYLLLLRTSPMNFAWCLLYGSIVSPTDPVAVISILNEKPGLLPSSTRYFVLGESLLNDAVGVVLYLVFSEIVVQPDMNYLDVFALFFKGFVLECFLGIVIGVALAWIAYSAIKSVDETLLEIAITFVLVGNINIICRMCHASIPLASVAAGLFIGNYATQFAMSETTTDTFNEMWKLLDETLNSVLFLLIGFADLFWEPQEIGWSRTVTIALSTICISLFARLVSVACPLFFIIFVEWITGRRLRHRAVRYRGGTIAVLTWGGMRGGISIALALGVPDAFVRHAVPGHMTYGQLIFFMTFALVVFSICVQGMFFEPVVRLINALSYRHFPSGGLGTYESQFFNRDGGSEDNVLMSAHDGGGDDELAPLYSYGGSVMNSRPPYPSIPVPPRFDGGAAMRDFYADEDYDDGDDTGVEGYDDVVLRAPLTPSGGVVTPRVMPPKASSALPAVPTGDRLLTGDGKLMSLPPSRADRVVLPGDIGHHTRSFGEGGGGMGGRPIEAIFPGGGASSDRPPMVPAAGAASATGDFAARMARRAAAPAAVRHRRDPSETFQNMGDLQQPVTLDEFLRKRAPSLWDIVGRRLLPSDGAHGGGGGRGGGRGGAGGAANARGGAATDDGGSGSGSSGGGGSRIANAVLARVPGLARGAAARDVGGKLRRSHTVHDSAPAQRRDDAAGARGSREDGDGGAR